MINLTNKMCFYDQFDIKLQSLIINVIKLFAQPICHTFYIQEINLNFLSFKDQSIYPCLTLLGNKMGIYFFYL